jgi:CheY-like chemotaxis protein
MMERQVKHMVRLIDDLLDVSRVTSGKMELSREAVSVSTLVTGAVEANREALTQGDIALAMNIGRPDLIVDVDATRFTQILSNLLNNAAKFTPPGGQVSVCDSLDMGPAGNCWLSITVTDTGMGISQELLPRIFDLFAQAESAGLNRHGGLGVGLALARRLAEMHWGTLEARSNGLNQGSAFVLRIPIREPKSSDESIDSQPALALTGLRALVIDDTRDAADVMQMLIESDGGIADVAYDGASGVTLAHDNKPEVILLDIGMPDMDGYETCRAIRKLVGKNVLVIALTGWGQEEVKRRALEAGFDAHLTKPVDPVKLTDLIHQLRDRSHSNH